MSTYVIDASVAVKWAFEEQFCPEALRYMDKRVERIAPDIILHECNSAVQKKVWKGEIQEEKGWHAYELIFEGDPIRLFDSRPLIKPAYDLAVTLNHAVYDCYYLALAEEQNALVVTADQKFYARILDSPFAQRIRWIGEPPEFST